MRWSLQFFFSLGLTCGSLLINLPGEREGREDIKANVHRLFWDILLETFGYTIFFIQLNIQSPKIANVAV